MKQHELTTCFIFFCPQLQYLTRFVQALPLLSGSKGSQPILESLLAALKVEPYAENQREDMKRQARWEDCDPATSGEWITKLSLKRLKHPNTIKHPIRSLLHFSVNHKSISNKIHQHQLIAMTTTHSPGGPELCAISTICWVHANVGSWLMYSPFLLKTFPLFTVLLLVCGRLKVWTVPCSGCPYRKTYPRTDRRFS